MSEMSEERKEINSKLSTATFTWTIGIILVVSMAIFASQNARITLIEQKLVDTQILSAKIETQLAGIQVQLVQMNGNLEKHMESKQ